MTAGNRVLLIAPHGSYRTAAYIDAAFDLGIELLVVSEGRNSIVSAYALGLHVDFDNPGVALERILNEVSATGISGIIATDDSTTELASRVSLSLGLIHNDPASTRIARRKDLARQCQRDHGLLVPHFCRVDLDTVLEEQIQEVEYPCLAKPLAMSASRGVIRADTRPQLLDALQRIAGIVADVHDRDERRCLLVETFIPGDEFALEGLLDHGQLVPLAIFEKPEPLDGPFFEESCYITPTRLCAVRQRQFLVCVEAACNAYGLHEGPVHAECRINDQGVWLLELAARTIGGLCSRLFRFGSGFSLEELVLRHAAGQSIQPPASSGYAGVLMIPVPKPGLLRRVEGTAAASRVRYIDEVVIQVRDGYELVPLPEGSSYLGFVFASAPDFESVQSALRSAHSHLEFVVAPSWPIVADRD